MDNERGFRHLASSLCRTPVGSLLRQVTSPRTPFVIPTLPTCRREVCVAHVISKALLITLGQRDGFLFWTLLLAPGPGSIKEGWALKRFHRGTSVSLLTFPWPSFSLENKLPMSPKKRRILLLFFLLHYRLVLICFLLLWETPWPKSSWRRKGFISPRGFIVRGWRKPG